MDAVQRADSAFTDFFHREFEPVVRTAFLVLRDAESAQDVAQDAFGQLYVNWPKVSRYHEPAAWVRRVAIRMAVRMARRDERRRLLSVTQGRQQAPAMSPEPSVDLAAALLMLPARQRAVLALHYFEDRPADEVGRLLGCSASTVRTHLARARARLAELLTDDEVSHAE